MLPFSARTAALTGLALCVCPLANAAPGSGAKTPTDIIATAPAEDWQDIPADQLLMMTLANDRQIIIQLAPSLSPAFVRNIRTLAQRHWWNGTAITRVQDNYVVQWGDPTEKKPLPAAVVTNLPQDYTVARTSLANLIRLPYPDSYAPETGFAGGWPVAMQGDAAWLPHCYGYVGVGRNNSPDAGTGAELYAVIGHAPRQLDRNVAVVGRVLKGMEHLSTLPRGTGEIGFYATPSEHVPIRSIRLASDLPEAQRPQYQFMKSDTASFAAYVKLRANRQDDFYAHPAGGVDVCNVTVPIRQKKP